MMIPEEKIREVKKKLRKGYPQGELINELLEQGYSSEEIQNAFYKNTDYPNNKSVNIPLWYAVSIGLIITGIAILSVKYLWIYNYGYIFLVLGLLGLFIKYIIDDAKKNK